MFGLKRKRREKLKAGPFPPEWQEIIGNVTYFRRLWPEDQEELRGRILVFMDEKRFEGLGGLEMTDEIRVTIAAQACVLLLRRETDYYPSLISILVYPRHYYVHTSHRLPDGTVQEGVEARLGVSWHRGEVVLSWGDVLRGLSKRNRGENVVFHEFAHQLDDENGAHDGVPLLPDRKMYEEWARVMKSEYERLIQDVEHYRGTVLRPYGTTNPAEFFAVSTEAFFENPLELKTFHPKLYEQLGLYYKQDPAARLIH